jgi:Zn-dependent oligopeptidase
MAQNVAEINNVVNELKAKTDEINSVLKNSKIDYLIRNLETLSYALGSIIGQKKQAFKLRLDPSERNIEVYVDEIYITDIAVNDNTTIQQVFEKLFTTEEIKLRLANKIYEKISELANEISRSANIYGDLEYIYGKLEDIERQLDP